MSQDNKPKASWTEIAGFGGKVESVETAFSEGVGGAYFEKGIYKDVFIESVEPSVSKAGNSMVLFNIQDDSGTRISYRVMLMPGKDGKGFHFTYQGLGRAIVQDGQLLMRSFGNLFPKDPRMLDSLRGMRLTIKVEEGKEGYKIQENAMGEKIIVDVETGLEYPELKGKSFADYTEAKEAAKELSIYACRNEVKRVSLPSQEYIEQNEAAISEILRAAEAPAGAKGPAASRAVRPTRTI